MASGTFHALSAYVIWGLVPVYWKLLQAIPADVILAHRVVWSFIFFLLLVQLRRQWPVLRTILKNRQALILLTISSALIGVNWYLFIYAVNQGHVLEASLGYFINPLMNVALGAWLLQERLSRARMIAILLAAGGVVLLGLRASEFPWLALSLATTFALYGLIRKRVSCPTLVASCLEAFLLVPLALVYLARLGSGPVDAGGAGVTPYEFALLAAGGVITGLPLLFFSEAAKRLPLSSLGFFQYIAPSLQFLLAVAVYREPFSLVQAASFGLIWCALGIFSWEALIKRRVRK